MNTKVSRMAFVNKDGPHRSRLYEGDCRHTSKLKCQAIAIQIPIGAESEFEGIVDLVKMKPSNKVVKWGR